MKPLILGILGGGQLGRMSAMAAAKLGIKTLIYTPETDSPAAQVADRTIIGAYEDHERLFAFANDADVISYEFENIPVETIRYLQTIKPVHPDDRLLEVAQDRIREKSYLNDIGIPTAPWAPAETPESVRGTLRQWGAEQCILKTTRFGYDGKGQAFVRSLREIEAAFNTLKGAPLIMEGVVEFTCEISVIAARDINGKTVTYGPMLNEHRNHILHKTTMPAPDLAPDLAAQATDITIKLAEALNLRGVLALEMFVTKDGRILANEIAPRTHNSGHWTIDACAVSQFENHVRAVCGLPVLDPGQHSAAEMINLIGEDILNLDAYKNRPGVFIHDYGKKDAKPGRKMGHVTVLKHI